MKLNSMARQIFPDFSFWLKIVVGLLAISQTTASGLTEFERTYKRTLSTLAENPHCEEWWCTNSTFTGGSLTHIVGTGPKDELHHLLSTVGAPTLLISRTKLGAKLFVNYTNFLSSVSYLPEGVVEHSLGLIFSSIYEFDDYDDKADLSSYDNSYVFRHDLTNLQWTLTKMNTDDSSSQSVMVNATSSGNDTLLSGDGHLSFIVRYDGKDGRIDSVPHMEHTANSSVITIIMSKFRTRFEHSRFAIELVMFSTDEKGLKQDATQVHTTNSLDDEYSPGVFQMTNWLPDENKKREDAWGYAQWKPAMYTALERKNADLSHATSYPNLPEDKHDTLNNIVPNRTLFRSYFGGQFDQVSMNATNVSFGVSKDKFYNHTNYHIWTMAVGMGPPPEDGVSTTVILVISVGLGIPLVLMIFSSVFVCVKAIKKRRAMSESEYTAINT